MSHTLKLFLKTVRGIIYKNLEETSAIHSCDTRDVRGAISDQRSLPAVFGCVNHDVFAFFINFEEVFNKVRYDKLKLFFNKNIDVSLISNLHCGR